MSHLDTPTESPDAVPRSLLRIQEVAAALGLTARTIRYYEELGLLTPAARSSGDYRLYDDDDVERLRFIEGLRDEAGFSLTESSQMLEDEAARARNRDRFRATSDAAEGRVFPYLFNPPTSHWSMNTAIIRFLGQRAGGMEQLKGRKIAHVYWDAEYGQETLSLLVDPLPPGEGASIASG